MPSTVSASTSLAPARRSRDAVPVSSPIVAVTGPETVGASLLPVIVTVIVCCVPSAERTVKVSVVDCPALRACTAGLVSSSV